MGSAPNDRFYGRGWRGRHQRTAGQPPHPPTVGTRNTPTPPTHTPHPHTHQHDPSPTAPRRGGPHDPPTLPPATPPHFRPPSPRRRPTRAPLRVCRSPIAHRPATPTDSVGSPHGNSPPLGEFGPAPPHFRRRRREPIRSHKGRTRGSARCGAPRRSAKPGRHSRRPPVARGERCGRAR